MPDLFARRLFSVVHLMAITEITSPYEAGSRALRRDRYRGARARRGRRSTRLPLLRSQLGILRLEQLDLRAESRKLPLNPFEIWRGLRISARRCQKGDDRECDSLIHPWYLHFCNVTAVPRTSLSGSHLPDVVDVRKQLPCQPTWSNSSAPPSCRDACPCTARRHLRRAHPCRCHIHPLLPGAA